MNGRTGGNNRQGPLVRRRVARDSVHILMPLSLHEALDRLVAKGLADSVTAHILALLRADPAIQAELAAMEHEEVR